MENEVKNENVSEMPQTNIASPPIYTGAPNQTAPVIPDAYKPISAWGYFGYNILFSIPLIGFILLLIFSFDNSKIVRRNYARSFFCSLLISVILIIIFVIIIAVAGITIDSLPLDFNRI